MSSAIKVFLSFNPSTDCVVQSDEYFFDFKDRVKGLYSPNLILLDDAESFFEMHNFEKFWISDLCVEKRVNRWGMWSGEFFRLYRYITARDHRVFDLAKQKLNLKGLTVSSNHHSNHVLSIKDIQIESVSEDVKIQLALRELVK